MILVTGARGNVGGAVLVACKARGLAAVGADRSASSERRFDFAERSTWAPALEGCTQLFLLRPPAISNVAQTLNPFVDFAREHGVGHVVFLSVQGAESRPRIPHYAVEKHLEQSASTEWTLLRPGFFAQNFTAAYLRDILEDDRIYLPAGDATVAFVDVRDLGRVAAQIFSNPVPHRGQGYRLTGPACFTFVQAAAILSRVTNRPIRYVPASAAGYLLSLVRRGAGLTQAVIQTYLHVGLRHGDAATVDPLLSSLLGERATDLEQFLTAAAPAFARSRGAT